MVSLETYAPSTSLIDLYQLPHDDGWTSIEDVPNDFRQIVELQMMARDDAPSIDQVTRSPVTLEDIQAIYDDWLGGQRVFTARDSEGHIIGMLSYYLESDGTPFFESVAVDPQVQGEGVGGTLIDHALADVAEQTPDVDFAITRAQPRVASLYERRWGAQEIDDEHKSGTIRMAIPIPR